MTIIINRAQRIAGVHYAENQSLTLGATTETDWVNKGWARWASGSEPTSPEPLYVTKSAQGVVLTGLLVAFDATPTDASAAAYPVGTIFVSPA